MKCREDSLAERRSVMLDYTSVLGKKKTINEVRPVLNAMSRYRIAVIFLLGLLLPFVALCSNRAANAFVSVECRTKGVLGVYLNGEDFYLTVDRDCAGSNFVDKLRSQ